MSEASETPPQNRRGASFWFVVEGVLLVVLGAAAAALPGWAGMAGALVFGWVLVLSGVFGVIALLGARLHTHVVWGAISAAIAILIGGLVLWRPMVGAIALALFVAAYLAADALAMLGLALDQRRRGARGWWWLLVSAVVDAFLAILILFVGPFGAVVLLGYVIAVDLVVGGFAMIALGWLARSR